MDDLDGRVAIVTGASRGIGRQIALELGRRGMTVVVAARTVDPHRRLPGTIGETVAAIEAAGGTALAVRTDVTVVEDLEQLVATAAAEFGRIDVLVNNAAETNSSAAPIDEMPRDTLAARVRRQRPRSLHPDRGGAPAPAPLGRRADRQYHVRRG